ncbi:MAG: lysophospholipid acyltransferase family protein [Fusobacteriota bacterium]
MGNKYFNSDSYVTPEDNKRKFLDKLFFNTRGYFVAKYCYIIMKNRSKAKKGNYDAKEWAKSSYNIFKIVEDCGGKYNISGLENIFNLKEPVVFASNHMSTLETMILPCMIAPSIPMTFVVKKSLVSHPFLAPILKSRDPIVVERENSREDLKTVLTEGVEKLQNGTSVLLFPEGTRHVEFEPKNFNSLGVKLAKKAGKKVVPVAIKTDFWEEGKGIMKDMGPIKRDRTVYIKFGKPIKIEGRGSKENKQIKEFISKNMENWEKNI